MELFDPGLYPLILLGILGFGLLAFDAGQGPLQTAVTGLAGLALLAAVLAAAPRLEGRWPAPAAVAQDDAAPGPRAGRTALPQVDGAPARRVVLRRAFDGHFYTDAQVNGRVLRFVVDTGATLVVLSREDASAAGLNPDALSYDRRARTANGSVAMAAVTLQEVVIGGVRLRGVRAAVNSAPMDTSLLGMSLLSEFRRMEIEGDRLRLTAK